MIKLKLKKNLKYRQNQIDKNIKLKKMTMSNKKK